MGKKLLYTLSGRCSLLSVQARLGAATSGVGWAGSSRGDNILIGEKYGDGILSSLSTVAALSSRVWEDGSNSAAGSLCCRRNLSASALNSSSRGRRTSDDAERLTSGNWRFFAGVGHVPSWKLWEFEYLLGRQQKDKTLENVTFNRV